MLSKRWRRTDEGDTLPKVLLLRHVPAFINAQVTLPEYAVRKLMLARRFIDALAHTGLTRKIPQPAFPPTTTAYFEVSSQCNMFRLFRIALWNEAMRKLLVGPRRQNTSLVFKQRRPEGRKVVTSQALSCHLFYPI